MYLQVGRGAPRNTAVEALRGDMRWSSVRERIIEGKDVTFLKEIEIRCEGRMGGGYFKKMQQDESGGKRWRGREGSC